MYAFEDMIEIGMPKGKKWKSDIHREVAIKVCICNPRVHTATCLEENVVIINKIPNSKIEKVTFADLTKLGCEI
jgi:hypothetical protein